MSEPRRNSISMLSHSYSESILPFKIHHEKPQTPQPHPDDSPPHTNGYPHHLTRSNLHLEHSAPLLNSDGSAAALITRRKAPHPLLRTQTPTKAEMKKSIEEATSVLVTGGYLWKKGGFHRSWKQRYFK